MGTSATVLDPRRGYFFAILAAFLWGVSGSAAKYLFINGVTPFHLVQLDIVTLNLLGIVSGLFSAVGFAWYSIRGNTVCALTVRGRYCFTRCFSVP